MTTIKYCGKLDTSDVDNCVDTLIQMLGEHTISKSFFMPYNDNPTPYNGKRNMVNFCPIVITDNGYKFWGNFEEYSFNFHITSSDPFVCDKLKQAIRSNKGWLMYYQKNKLQQGQGKLF